MCVGRDGGLVLSGLRRRITKEVGQNGLQKHGSDLLDHDHYSLSRNNVLKGKINSRKLNKQRHLSMKGLIGAFRVFMRASLHGDQK